MGKIEEKIERANAALDKVKIRIKGERLYLRGTFPPKPGDGDREKQYELSTGLKATPEGVMLAKAKAQEIESLLIREKFDWTPHLKEKQKPAETVAEWVRRLEEDFWSGRSRNDLKKQTTWEYYRSSLSILPQDEPLTAELLKQHVLAIPAASHKRKKFCTTYQMLAKFAGLETNLASLGRGYEANPNRYIPSDAEIEEWREQIEDPAWQWVFGMLAAYGLRPSEVFHLDISRLETGRLDVKPQTKTGARTCWPILKSWWEEWELWKGIMPNIRSEGKTNKYLGAKIGTWFYLRDWRLPKGCTESFTPYSLRDAYAIRGAYRGVPVTTMAQWMGHSLDTHFKHYHKYANERHHQAAWEKNC